MKKLEEAGINNAIKFYMVYEEERKILEDENKIFRLWKFYNDSGECSMGNC